VKKPDWCWSAKASLQESVAGGRGNIETPDLNRVKIVHKNQGGERQLL